MQCEGMNTVVQEIFFGGGVLAFWQQSWGEKVGFGLSCHYRTWMALSCEGPRKTKIEPSQKLPARNFLLRQPFGRPILA